MWAQQSAETPGEHKNSCSLQCIEPRPVSYPVLSLFAIMTTLGS